MAGLKWVRLDCTFAMNPKVLALVADGRHRAITAYVCGLAYAGSQGTEGWIPAGALAFIHARRVDAAHLVEAGLWIARPGGWDIHDWHEYQPTTQDMEKRTARARAAALTRWNQSQPDAPSNARSIARRTAT